ncbi:MAG: histidinol-phosphatase [Verrucomicrobiota bacterium]|nr:histidinol-phosphatase [Verrucomicrobiota bacterium]
MRHSRNLTTYHCHTRLSDGKNSVKEMIDAATQKGFKEIGFSDHLVLHPEIRHIEWAMPVNKLADYVAEVRSEAVNSKISVKLGLEVDFFPNNPRIKELLKILKSFDFDFLVGSIHFLSSFPLDYAKTDWASLSKKEINEKYEEYWDAMKQLMQSEIFTFVGHLDLPKKFTYYPSKDFTGKICDVLDVAKENRKIIEINTSGWNKPCKEAYPSEKILQMCARRNIPIIINDDAHSVAQLGQHFEKAEKLAIKNACSIISLEACLN